MVLSNNSCQFFLATSTAALKVMLLCTFLFCIVPFNLATTTNSYASHTTTKKSMSSTLASRLAQVELNSKDGQLNLVEPPQGWFCSVEHYNSRDGCHCLCGAHDPDCDLPASVVSSADSTLRELGEYKATMDVCTENGTICSGPCSDQRISQQTAQLLQQHRQTKRQAQQQIPQFRTYNLKTQVNAITILAVANTLLGGLLMIAVVLILCIMCASDKTLQQNEHEQTDAERRMDEAFPTIFMRMRRQASRLFFWRNRRKLTSATDEEPKAVAGDTKGKKSFRESLRKRFLGHRDKHSDEQLVAQQNAEEADAVIRDNAEAAAANHPAEVHLDQHPHSQ